MSSEGKTEPKFCILITSCLCEPCPIYYTDTITESVLIRCKNPTHDIVKVESRLGNGSDQANPDPNQRVQPSGELSDECKYI